MFVGRSVVWLNCATIICHWWWVAKRVELEMDAQVNGWLLQPLGTSRLGLLLLSELLEIVHVHFETQYQV